MASSLHWRAMGLVLVSGGADSAVLLASELQSRRCRPLYVRMGLAWEAAELRALVQLLAHPLYAGRTSPLLVTTVDLTDAYTSEHWAVRGVPPAYDSPDVDVLLEGRNLALLTKAAIIAVHFGETRIALGLLRGNPFPDARPEFLAAMQSALSLGLGQAVEVQAPFADWNKPEVIALGNSLEVPWPLTLSCMRPILPDDPQLFPLPCGACSKCRERDDAFAGRT